MKKINWGLLVMLFVATLLIFQSPIPANASTITFDPGSQFFSNPNGMWSYGWKTSRDGIFNLYTDYLRNDSTAQTDRWYNNQIGIDLGVLYNGTGTVCHLAGTTSFRPGKLVLHPGPNGEYSVLRWTAPVKGDFNVIVRFTGVSGYNGAQVTTTDVAVFKNGTRLYLGYINLNGNGNTSIFTTGFSINAGDTLDFIVGNGNGSYYYDSTEVDVSIF